MKLKWYIFYEDAISIDLKEFSSKEEMNSFLSELTGARYIKVISGYTLAERSAK